MDRPSFIGLMGIQRPEERGELSRLAPLFEERPHRLLLGAYADWLTLHGMTGRAFLPSKDALAAICEPDDNADIAVHFTPAWERSLAEQLYDLMSVCPGVSVLILHAVWPKRDTLAHFRHQWPNTRLVLWVSEECYIDLSESSTRVARRVAGYAQIGVVDSVMFDLASGSGAPIDNARAVMTLRMLRQAGIDIPCGLAGGLSAERFDAGFTRVVRDFDPLSLVASRHIRRNDRIDADLARQFVERALHAAARDPLQP